MSGLIILPIFLFYVAVAFLILKAVTKNRFQNVSKTRMNVIISIIVLVFPFWDLLAVLGVRTVFQAFFLEPIIYEYPVKDSEGKVESLSAKLTPYFIDPSTLESDTKKEIVIKKVYPNIKDKVSDFIELKTLIDRDINDKPIYGFAKIYIKQNDMPYELIETSQARYTGGMSDEKTDYNLLGFHYRYSAYEVQDTVQNKVIAKAPYVRISGLWIMDKFRTEVLMLKSGPTEHRLFGVGSGKSFWHDADDMLTDLFHIEGV